MFSPMKLTSSASFSLSIRISLRLKIHQAQAKNFCRVLDIRVTEIVESEMLQSDVLQDLLVEVYHAVRVVHLSGQGRGEQVGVVWVFAVLLDQQIHRCLWDGYQPHGVLCLGPGHFQRTVRVADILLSNGDRPLLNIQIVPPQGHQFSLPQTADQFQIEHW